MIGHPVSRTAERRATLELESARSVLTARHLSNLGACQGVGAWALGSASAANEHTIPPVHRIGAIAWLARVALRDEEHAA